MQTAKALLVPCEQQLRNFNGGITLGRFPQFDFAYLTYEAAPGRLNVFEFGDFNIVLDYAHNPHGVKALGNFVQSFQAKTKVGIITGVGDGRG